jgi:hypothetical protein
MDRQLKFMAATLVGCLLATSTGCIAKFAANMLNASLGNKVLAKFDGLEENRVAIISVSGSASFGSTSAADIITSKVEAKLRKNVRKIRIVDQQVIGDWMDRNDWNEVDYQEVGEAVGADIVVAVDIQSFSLYDGPTLFRGKSDVIITVYDIRNRGAVLFEESPPQIVYPIAAGLHVSGETNETDFRRRFVDYVAERIARNFYAYDATTDFGQDALVLGSG